VIDTNTVNFAMNKLNGAFQAVLPTMTNVSAAYVKFVVMQQIVYVIGIFLGACLCAGIFIPVYRHGKKENELDETQYFITLVITGIVGVAMLALFIPFLVDMILAISNPEMFTVDKIIHAAQRK